MYAVRTLLIQTRSKQMTKSEALAAKSGPMKKFYLLKHWGAELRAQGHSVEHLRTLSCDQIIDLIINLD